MIVRLTRSLVTTQMLGPPWASDSGLSGVGSKNLHSWTVFRRCCCCWSRTSFWRPQLSTAVVGLNHGCTIVHLRSFKKILPSRPHSGAVKSASEDKTQARVFFSFTSVFSRAAKVEHLSFAAQMELRRPAPPGSLLEMCTQDLPGGPVVKTPSFQCWGHQFDPWSGN